MLHHEGQVWTGTVSARAWGAVVPATRFRRNKQEIAVLQRGMALILRNRFTEDREYGVRPLIRRHVDVADLRCQHVLFRWLQWIFKRGEQFLAIQNLDDAIGSCSVGCVNAILAGTR